MARVKIDFAKKPIPQQIQKSRDITGKMTGNPAFLSPSPNLAEIITLTNDLEIRYIDALDGGKDKKAKMRITQRELERGISKLAAYVQTASGGDETIILSSGFGVRKQPVPVGIPATPQDVKVLPAVKENELELVWTPVRTIKSYVLEMTQEPLTEEGFAPVDVVTKANAVLPNLKAGTKYWFRIMAVNTKGKSAWSEPCSGRTMQF